MTAPDARQQTEAQIERTTVALVRKAHRLEDRLGRARTRFEQLIDPREHVRAHPWLWLGRAFAAGLVLGALQGRAEHR